jgi:hypothetical protein
VAGRRNGYRGADVSSSPFEEVVEAVSCFEALKKMKTTRILDVTDSQG